MPTFTAIVLLFAGWVTIVLTYRIYLHPLRHFPGPKAAAISILYRAWYQIVRDGGQLKQWGKLHERYGPVIRIAPNQLHFSSPGAFEQIYTFKPIFLKDEDFYSFTGQTEVLFGMSDDKRHKERFKLVASLFTPKGIYDFEPFIHRNTQKLCRIFDDYAASTKPVNMALAFRAVALDIVLDFVFESTPAQYRGMHSASFDGKYHLSTYDIMDWTTWVGRNFPVFLKVTPWIPRRWAKLLVPGDVANGDFIEMTESIVEKCLRTLGSARDCFLARFPKDDPLQLLSAECEGTILGGVVDLANVLQYGTFCVYEDALLAEAVYREVTAVWPMESDRIPETAQLESLSLLTGVIKESLRLTHGVITGPPRISPAAGAIVDGYNIPPGTVVSTSSYYSHLDPATFSDPQAFVPTRWRNAASNMERALSAFGKGRRACPGKAMAMTELYIIFATLFRKFRFAAHNTRLQDFELKAYLSVHFAGPAYHARVEVR